MRISDCSSDVCSSDLTTKEIFQRAKNQRAKLLAALVTRKLALNMRQLEIVTGIERSTICRRLTELQAGGKEKLANYRSEARSEGQECVRQERYRWWRSN